MTPFKKYQHLERFGTTEVENIEIGECYVFPKLDGTNASVWQSGTIIKAGSRTRELDLDKDNAGFYNWVLEQDNIKKFLSENPGLRLFGEWLVPHSLKTYKENAWRNFYVFDVVKDNGDTFEYLHYDIYSKLLDGYNIQYIPLICKIKNGSYEQFVKALEHNDYLIQDGKGVGEGIVIKNYEYKNKYGRVIWAKIVTSEFKEQHRKVMGNPTIEGKKMIEEEIVHKYVTKALCEKVYEKIRLEDGWNSKMIPRLLNTVYYDLVREDCWNFVKEHKNPVINFKTLQFLTNQKVKEHLNELF